MFEENFTPIAILVFTVPFIFTVLIVWIQSVEKRKRNQLKADLYFKALEKGQSVPTELLAKLEKKENPLHTGIILILMGIGISIMLWLIIGNNQEGQRIASVGLLPFLMGVAQLIIHHIEKKKGNRNNA